MIGKDDPRANSKPSIIFPILYTTIPVDGQGLSIPVYPQRLTWYRYIGSESPHHDI